MTVKCMQSTHEKAQLTVNQIVSSFISVMQAFHLFEFNKTKEMSKSYKNQTPRQIPQILKTKTK